MKEHSRKNKAEDKSQEGPSMFMWWIFTDDYGKTLINRLPQLLHQTDKHFGEPGPYAQESVVCVTRIHWTWIKIRFFFRIFHTRIALRVTVILIEEILVLFGHIKQSANVSSFQKTYSLGARQHEQLMQSCWIN
jgi:hypothetical protein